MNEYTPSMFFCKGADGYLVVLQDNYLLDDIYLAKRGFSTGNRTAQAQNVRFTENQVWILLRKIDHFRMAVRFSIFQNPCLVKYHLILCKIDHFEHGPFDLQLKTPV